VPNRHAAAYRGRGGGIGGVLNLQALYLIAQEIEIRFHSPIHDLVNCSTQEISINPLKPSGKYTYCLLYHSVIVYSFFMSLA
jgi:hypothetical protein